MRTDSNTVLPLSSGISPKKSSLVKTPSTNGEAFANDFNKAKEALSPSKTSTTDESSASTASSASSSTNSSSTVKTPDSGDVPTNNETKGDGLSDSASNVVATATGSVESSGNILQEDGGKAPSNGVSAVLVEEDPELLSVVVSPDLKNAENTASASASVSQGKQSGDTMPSELQSAAVESMVESEAPEGAMVPIASVGVAGLDAIKRSSTNEVSKIDLLPKSKMLSESDSGSVELLDAHGEGELSWVMSQMASSGAKAAPAMTSASVALDAAKVTTVAAGVAGAINKNGRSDVTPLILSESALVASGSSEMNLEITDSLLGEDGVLINEPIELRKKEQEIMLGRMSAQIDGTTSDVGGLSSSLQNNVNRSAGIAAAVPNNPVPNAQTNLTMNLPPSHPGWASEMSQKVAWVARDGGHTAHIRLDPPELGSLTVKVSVDSDSNTQVSFVAATPQARDLLEGQMGRLREMLAQQGMDLSRADVDVSQQDTSNAQDRGNDRNNSTNQNDIVDSDDELIANNLSYVSASGVDYYA